MTTAPVQIDEETLIREFIKQIDMPPGVKFKRIEPTVDSVGEDAWRIYFSVDVSSKYPLTKKRYASLNLLTNTLSKKIFAANIAGLPLYKFLEVK